MSDLCVLEEFFKPYKASLQKISFDTTNQKDFCKSTEKAFYFDEYMKDKSGADNKSFDALYFDYELSHIYCIEFKKREHGKGSSKPGRIKGKFIDGINELKNVFENQGLEITNYKFHLFVIFKSPLEYKKKKDSHLEKRAAKYSMNAEKSNFLTKDDDFKQRLPLCQEINKPDIRVGYIRDFMEDYKKLFHHESDC